MPGEVRRTIAQMSKLSTEEFNIAVGQRLGAVRERSRLVQTEFAETLGLSPRAYQNL